VGAWSRSRDITFLPCIVPRQTRLLWECVSIGNLGNAASERVGPTAAASVAASDSTFPLPGSPLHHGSCSCLTNGQILPSSQLIPETVSMAGSGPNPQGNKYTHNDAAFAEYNTRLQSSNLPTFTSAVSKFTEWLGSDKAYYSNARASVRLPSWPPRRILLIVVDLHSDRLHY